MFSSWFNVKHSELSEASQLAYRDSGWLHSFLFAALADTFLPRKDQNYALPEFSKSKLWESQQNRVISHLSGRGTLRARPSCPAHGLSPFCWKKSRQGCKQELLGLPAQIAVVQTRSPCWDPALHGSPLSNCHNPPTLRQNYKPYKVPLISDAGSFHQGIE